MMTARKCEFSGYKKPVAWECKKLFGAGGTICTCGNHKPGSGLGKVSPELRAKIEAMRPMYECKPVG